MAALKERGSTTKKKDKEHRRSDGDGKRQRSETPTRMKKSPTTYKAAHVTSADGNKEAFRKRKREGDFKEGDGAQRSASGPKVKKVVLDRKGRKELAETRKKAKRINYDLEKEALQIWEKIRQRGIKDEDRSSLITQLLPKMKGKMCELAVSHSASRVVQTCVRHCTAKERADIFAELRPQALELSRNTYGHFLVVKMLDQANNEQRSQLLAALRGNVVALLRHPSGSSVVEQAYQSANKAQQLNLVTEFYAPEFRLFKDILPSKNASLAEYVAAVPALKKGSILQHLTLSLQPILEKGIVDHTIIHRVIAEYFTVCSKRMMKEVVEQLAGPVLVRMIHTKEGASVGNTCVAAGSVKERKKIIKGMKGHVSKICLDKYGHLVLMRLLDVVDDTKLLGKVIIPEIVKELKTISMDKIGHRVLLHLLAPRVKRYFPPDVLSWLEPLKLAPDVFAKTVKEEETKKEPGAAEEVEEKGDGGVEALEGKKIKKEDDIEEGEGEKKKKEGDAKGKKRKKKESDGKDSGEDEVEEGGDGENDEECAIGLSKKDPEVRRLELLRDTGLAQKLVELCEENAEEMLKDQSASFVLFEVANGGLGGILWRCRSLSLCTLKETIAELATVPSGATEIRDASSQGAEATKGKKGAMKKGGEDIAKVMMSGGGDVAPTEGPKGIDEPILEHYFASRTLRRLVTEFQEPPEGTESDEPFPAVLWRVALKGRCKELALGHSAKVVTSLLACRHEDTKKAAMEELRPLIDSGALDGFKEFFRQAGGGTSSQSPEKSVRPKKSRNKE